ncbi:MAG: hypothetical protein ACYS74_24080, partial [Planctomycetota bacterium]
MKKQSQFVSLTAENAECTEQNDMYVSYSKKKELHAKYSRRSLRSPQLVLFEKTKPICILTAENTEF